MDCENQAVFTMKRTRIPGHTSVVTLVACCLLVLSLVTTNIDAQKNLLDDTLKQYMPSSDSCARGDDIQPQTTKLTVDAIFSPTNQKEKCSGEGCKNKPIPIIDFVIVPLILLVGLAVSMIRMSQSIVFVADIIQRER